jgi:parallel beta-helix repeat protein
VAGATRIAAALAVACLVALAGASSSGAAPGVTITVSTTADSGANSLRDAITHANLTKAKDTIHFSIGSGAQTIMLASALPAITAPIVIDGSSQPGFTTQPLITLDGQGGLFPCVDVAFGASKSAIEALILQHCTAGLAIEQKVASVEAAGNWYLSNTDGADVDGSKNTIDAGRVALNSDEGIDLGGTSNAVADVYIGTNAAGTAAAANGFGIFDDGVKSSVTGNLVSGNSSAGIDLNHATAALVAGNYVGTTAGGAAALGNQSGIVVLTAGNTITGNLVSGNTLVGIEVDGDGNTLSGNFVGVNSLATAVIPNGGAGIDVSGGANAIGLPGAGNLVGGNTTDGIRVDVSAGNVVQGNLIGTNGTNAMGFGNHDNGIYLDVATVVGGSKPGQGNVISGNSLNGVLVTSFGGGSTIAGNTIGATASGTTALPNGSGGIEIDDDSNTIVHNEIAGNHTTGIYIEAASHNVIQGNSIGVFGATPVPNLTDGILVVGNSDGNVIGAGKKGGGNLIEYNGSAGVDVAANAATGNSILGNAIAHNGFGIDLGADGVTVNDADDTDTGPNNLQNFPTFGSFSPTVIPILLSSNASRTYRIDLFVSSSCDASGNGQGTVFLGAYKLTTDGTGAGTIYAKYKNMTNFTHFAATATDLSTGDTSEFGPCTP